MGIRISIDGEMNIHSGRIQPFSQVIIALKACNTIAGTFNDTLKIHVRIFLRNFHNFITDRWIELDI